jgi:hypothetical protein
MNSELKQTKRPTLVYLRRRRKKADLYFGIIRKPTVPSVSAGKFQRYYLQVGRDSLLLNPCLQTADT